MRPGPDEVLLRVRVTPRAGRDEIDGVRDRVLHVRVAVSPVDGAANAAVARLIADALGVSRSAVRLVAGPAGRLKTLAVEGVSPREVAERWPDLGV